MGTVQRILDEQCRRRALGEKVLVHSESLLEDGKLSDIQYLDLCNAAQIIHNNYILYFRELDDLVNDMERTNIKVQKLKGENQKLEDKNQKLKYENQKLKDENQKLKDENSGVIRDEQLEK